MPTTNEISLCPWNALLRGLNDEGLSGCQEMRLPEISQHHLRIYNDDSLTDNMCATGLITGPALTALKNTCVNWVLPQDHGGPERPTKPTEVEVVPEQATAGAAAGAAARDRSSADAAGRDKS